MHLKNIFIGLVFLNLIAACKEDSKPVLSESNGRMNHLLVVMDSEDWKDNLGQTFRDMLAKPIAGLPQEEFHFDVSRIPHVAYTSMMKRSRNILVFKKGKDSKIKTFNNKFASPQHIVEVQAPDANSLSILLDQNKKKLIGSFRNADIKNVQKNVSKTAYAENQFETLKKLNISVQIPNKFKLVEDTGHFLWLRQHLSGGIAVGDGTSNLIIYSVPFKKKVSMVQLRDSIGEIHLRGAKDNMFMVTEKLYKPVVEKVTMLDRVVYETRGKWEVINDWMAGPFLNYMIPDPKNNRFLIIEGFTYAPSVDKRDYMFELEAIIKSLQLK